MLVRSVLVSTGPARLSHEVRRACRVAAAELVDADGAPVRVESPRLRLAMRATGVVRRLCNA